MSSPLDVEPNALIKNVAAKLKQMGLEQPSFVRYVKSGSHVERPPDQEDFWYIRCAAILRHLYVNNGKGVQRLRKHFGGRKNRGRKPEHKVKAGGSIIRKALQQLEKAGLVEKKEGQGRVITSKGISLLAQAAKECKA